jgi:hypothetical protein
VISPSSYTSFGTYLCTICLSFEGLGLCVLSNADEHRLYHIVVIIIIIVVIIIIIIIISITSELELMQMDSGFVSLQTKLK